MPAAFYVRDGERWLATELTRGPWSSALQHGGPPAAVLAGAIESFGDDASRFIVTRLTFEFLRPIPIAAFTVRCEPVRLGNRAQRIDATLVHDGVDVARAHGLRVRTTGVPLPSPRCPRRSAPRGPAGLEPWTFPFFRDRVAYHTGVEVRIARGVWGKGPTAAWMRMMAPLCDSQPTSPLQTLVTLADAANGVCPVLDPRQYSFINADMSLHLDRPPVGEWFALDVRATADPLGIGLTHCDLHDRDGELGHALQCLVIDTRSSSGLDA